MLLRSKRKAAGHAIDSELRNQGLEIDNYKAGG